jgi:hypothetical protein
MTKSTARWSGHARQDGVSALYTGVNIGATFDYTDALLARHTPPHRQIMHYGGVRIVVPRFEWARPASHGHLQTAGIPNTAVPPCN